VNEGYKFSFHRQRVWSIICIDWIVAKIMMSWSDIIGNDAQRQVVSRSNIPPRIGPCQIEETFLVTMNASYGDGPYDGGRYSMRLRESSYRNLDT
jgi:hypothetical protein